MGSFVDNLCVRAGRRLLILGQRRAFANLPGMIRVAQFEITGLKPLGGFRQPGVTKAGRLSFAGFCEGRRVKVYSAYSAAQNSLRKSLQELDFSPCAFPELIAMDEHLVVEAWVEGQSVASLQGSARQQAELSVRSFLEDNLSRTDLQSVVTEHGEAFCYLQDYLLTRLGVWRHWGPVADFVENWKARYSALSELLPRHLSHPDLSAANLVREQDTGRLMIIDNELLGIGHGWILDGRNSLLGADIEGMCNLPADFLDATWRLRQLGTALDANDFSRVEVLCRS